MIHQYHAGGRAKWHWRKVNDEWGGKQTQHCLERGSIGGGHSLVAVGCEKNRAFLSIHLQLVFVIIHQVHAVGAEKHIKGSKGSPRSSGPQSRAASMRPACVSNSGRNGLRRERPIYKIMWTSTMSRSLWNIQIVPLPPSWPNRGRRSTTRRPKSSDCSSPVSPSNRKVYVARPRF